MSAPKPQPVCWAPTLVAVNGEDVPVEAGDLPPERLSRAEIDQLVESGVFVYPDPD